MVGFGNPPNDTALVRAVLAGDPVGLRTGRKDREAVGARRGLVQEVGSDVLGLPRHRPADPLGRGGHAPDPMAGRFSDLAVASTNHRKTQASSTAAGGAYVLRRLTPPQTAKVQLRTHPKSDVEMRGRPNRIGLPPAKHPASRAARRSWCRAEPLPFWCWPNGSAAHCGPAQPLALRPL